MKKIIPTFIFFVFFAVSTSKAQYVQQQQIQQHSVNNAIATAIGNIHKSNITKKCKCDTKKNLEQNYIVIDLCNPRIYYDTAKGRTYNRLQMKSRELNVFKLINANTIKYNYILNRSFIQFNTDVSKNGLDAAVDKLKDAKSQADDKNQEKQPTQVKQSVVKDTSKISATNALLNNNIKLLSNQSKQKLSAKARSEINNQLANIKLEMKANTTMLITDKNELKKINNERYETADKLHQQEFLKNYNDFIISSKSDLSYLTGHFTVDTTLLKGDYLKALSSSNKYLDSIKNVLNSIEEYAVLHNCIGDSVLKKIPKQAQITSAIDFVKDLTTQYNDTFLYPGRDFSSLNETIIKNSEDILNLFTSVSTLSTDVYMLPLDVNGKNIDLVRINLQITEKEKPASLDSYTYDIYVAGGFKFDFSAGLFVTKLTDNNYTFKDVMINDTAKKTIQKTNNGNFNFGVGSMVNVTLRTGASWVAPGISFGALLSNQQKLQLLAGPTLTIGKEERILLHGGIALGAVSTLDSNYEVNHPYVFGETTTPPTVQKFSTNYFFGITYNLTGSKALTPNITK